MNLLIHYNLCVKTRQDHDKYTCSYVGICILYIIILDK